MSSKLHEDSFACAVAMSLVLLSLRMSSKLHEDSFACAAAMSLVLLML